MMHEGGSFRAVHYQLTLELKNNNKKMMHDDA
jgi:hypothetical protein